MTNPLFRYNVLAICVVGAMQPIIAHADTTDDDPTVQLETIKIKVDGKKAQKQSTSQTVKTAEELSKELVSDGRDLTRYETGVTVVETGRFGASGYSIRGVDENRVAINIDGLRQAETLASQGFKELFEGYGNFNNTRNSVEIENLKKATITKGADSVASGSGALGGAVTFDTKEANDFLTEKDWHVGYKTGYSTADNQKFGSLTLAGKLGKVDALLVATRRNGHETENYDYDSYDPLVQGRTREKADPYHITQDSTLLKVGFEPTENHRFDVSVDNTERVSKGHDFSYVLRPSHVVNYKEDALRHTNDQSKRNALSFAYTNYQPNPLWDEAKIRFTKQDITTKARTDDYCDGSDCGSISNPLGLQIVNGKIVDKNGNEPSIIDIDGSLAAQANGEIYHTGYKTQRPDQYWFDCSIIDCHNPMTIHQVERYPTVITKKQVVLDKKYQDPTTGKTYAQTSSTSWKDAVIIPNNTGYNENLWSDRDLNTDTKQINLDFKKYATLGNTDHRLAYGANYNITDKSMVNKAGASALDVKWWTNPFLGLDSTGKPWTCSTVPNADKWNSNLCPTENTFSFLIPVKTKDSSLYLTDKVKLHDRFSIDLGYRYNKIKYQPNYIAGETAKIPDDMVKGLFIPLPEGIGAEPRYWNYPGSFNDPQYKADLANYRAKKAEYDQAIADNPAQNIAYFAQPKSHAQHSYAISPTWDATDNIRLQAKYAKGFRMPTVDEMYFTFQHPDITVLPNVDLKPEIAKTKELALTAHGKYGFITGSIFDTKYDDFIDFIYLGSKDLGNIHGGQASSRNYPLYQSVNRQSAKVKGFEISSRFDVGNLTPSLQGFNVSYKYTHQKGRVQTPDADEVPMNAIQPNTSVIGVGYDDDGGKFGGNLYITHAGEKRAKDSYNIFWKEEGAKDSFAKWRSDGYTTIDLTGYYKPTKNITLQAGVYNLTNRKYITWDSARSIRSFGTSNLVDKTTGLGINRFYAPERNFKVSAEFKF